MKLIDADELIKRIQDIIDFGEKPNRAITLFSEQHILSILDNMKTVDIVKHGHWIVYPTLPTFLRCSLCNNGVYWHKDNKPNYCLYCGAKMDGDANETDR